MKDPGPLIISMALMLVVLAVVCGLTYALLGGILRKERAEWRWRGRRWQAVLAAIAVLFGIGVLVEKAISGPWGTAALFAEASTAIVLILGLATDRSWGVGRRIVGLVVAGPLWAALFFAGLYFQMWISNLFLMEEVQPPAAVLVDAFMLAECVPLVILALRRSRWFVCPTMRLDN